MKISYKDLSDKIGAKLAFIRNRTIKANKKNAYVQLSKGIEALLPFIKEHSSELKEIPWDDFNKVEYLICRGQDILKKCEEGEVLLLEQQIELFENGINLCGRKSFANLGDLDDLSRLKLRQRELGECERLRATPYFQLLSSLKENLNINDNKELSPAFEMIAGWKEAQDEIASIAIDEVLEGSFEVNSLSSNEQAEDAVGSNQPQNDNIETSSDEHDILLRDIFGEHLDDFLKEARLLKKGAEVARLVNHYVRNYKLEKSIRLNTPLRNALLAKGINTASKATWNNTIHNK